MKCEICGKEIQSSINIDKNICSHRCFLIDFWNEALDKDAIIINGYCYHIGKTGCKPHGFGGQSFFIQMNDGRKIKTNNLWSNGEVPLERNVKDNAKFIEPF